VEGRVVVDDWKLEVLFTLLAVVVTGALVVAVYNI
jgi:hypothetical protein